MALNLPVFYKRTASAIVYAAVMLTGLLWNDWAFLALVCLINFLCLREYFRLMKLIDRDNYWPAWLPVAMQVISLFIICLFSIRTNDQVPGVLWAAGGLLPVVPVVLILISALSKKGSLMALTQSLTGLFYITLPAMMLPYMHMRSFYLPLVLICMIWSNDTFAYLVGSFIGKTPFSKTSPKKTWEGTIGGALLTMIGAAICGYFLQIFKIPDWTALALCATVAGTLGDLLESKLKRMADVKDSGTMMPGHGGALDRFDSLLVATPFAFVYFIYFMR